ncbi:MAG: energy transducer TonB [Blastocatellia bacterium]
MNLFVTMAIVIARCVFLNSPPQTPSILERQSLLEKRAVVDTQRILTSELDDELPGLPFADWFRQVVGPGAGVIWQLSECGEQADAAPDLAGGMRACAEFNAILPDNRKVVVMIAVGTFKKGTTGAPVFCYGVIEQQGELYPVRRLRDLPKLLRAPGSLVNRPGAGLPAVDIPKVGLVVNDVYGGKLPGWSGGEPGQPVTIEAVEAVPPPPQVKPQPSPAENQKVSEESGMTPKLSEAVLWGDAITKVQPRYPANAKRVNASGPVDVKITISEAGRVIEARAINGHPLLRDAAVEASRQWVFKPAILNGVPVETQIVLTFVFRVSQ